MKKILFLLLVLLSFKSFGQTELCGTASMDSDISVNLYTGQSILAVKQVCLDMSHSFSYLCNAITGDSGIASGYAIDVTAAKPRVISVDTTKGIGSAKVATEYYVLTHSGTGTVTNIATGYGAKGGPITTTGTISVDTTSGTGSAKVATEYYVLTHKADIKDSAWTLFGNSKTNSTINFLGTKDTASLSFRVDNISAGFMDDNTQTYFGYDACPNHGTGTLRNTAIGVRSLQYASTAQANTAVGIQTLRFDTTIGNNVAIGGQCMDSLHQGFGFNTGVGVGVFEYMQSGGFNVGVGMKAGMFDSSGGYNVFVGAQAGYYNRTGDSNTFVGTVAGVSNVSGFENCFYGQQAGQANTTGSRNVYIGSNAGSRAQVACSNVEIGHQTGYYINNPSGKNTIIGDSALCYSTFTSGYNDIAIGYQAGVGFANVSNAIWIGNSSNSAKGYMYNHGNGLITFDTTRAGGGTGSLNLVGSNAAFRIPFVKTASSALRSLAQLVFDSTNYRLGIGLNSGLPTADLEVHGTQQSSNGGIYIYSNGTYQPARLTFKRSRGTQASPTILSVGDTVFSVRGQPYTNAYTTGSGFRGIVEKISAAGVADKQVWSITDYIGGQTDEMSLDSAGLKLTNPLTVANGGMGTTSNTAYAVICGGTTSTGPTQNVSGVGTSGQVLTSNGASALPTWQTVSTGTTLTNAYDSTGNITWNVWAGGAKITSKTKASQSLTVTSKVITMNCQTSAVGYVTLTSGDGGDTLLLTNAVDGGVYTVFVRQPVSGSTVAFGWSLNSGTYPTWWTPSGSSSTWGVPVSTTLGNYDKITISIINSNYIIDYQVSYVKGKS